ncbi:two-component regulatory system protein; signal transduction histidine kinase ATPase [Cupriavidus taiwanensis]|uniref:histidine kinase n=1 Tax=Cupriavidus taiwanensis TaxID=164546 RepID=A0A976B0U7_9BURK|nr:PAS domain S-box protein [Cupriavidus taiwanensis]SOZ64733.1 two-component regulatory system protein; signal transduction histidine kinase ATPase [Cupriavidus taiwanensis]SOZ65654.1 two-component regulatory system protein; signal transduction histidine kinase ATPase [Cupriavidus taiwanensis]SOZ69332.1 two-component regulatory system protein; signal transduction histidine kinase ATPase [Cupriavidus taiwanensis]SPA08483.1 two-component regulatory system protein; signal transduction histidine k
MTRRSDDPQPLAGNVSSPEASGPDYPNAADTPYRTLVEAVQDYAIFTLDVGGHVSSWNKGAARIKGYRREEILGKHFSQFYTPDAVARRWPDAELKAAAELGRFEDEGWRVRKDGSRFWANVIITALRDAEGRLIGFGKVTRDLTEQRRAAEALRQSEESLRLLVEGVKDYALFMLDPGGHIVSWNSGASYIKGYRRDEIIGRHFSLFYPQEDIAAGKPARHLDLARRAGRVEDEGWRVRKDGSLFWANVTLTAVYDDSRALRGFAKVTRDMSERRRREELERSSQRLNEFLATLSHELRNPLAPVRSALTAMRLAPGDGALANQSLALIERQVTHLSRLVDDLLDIGRITSGRIELRTGPVELDEIIGLAIEGARPALDAKSQRVDVQRAPGTIRMDADKTRLVQVMQNLVLNASKFSPPGTVVTIATAVQNRTLEIRVTDQGRGISPHALEDIFQLFVQESRPGTDVQGGLGIGLSLCRSLVELHGGTIAATSAGPGLGSTFTLRLPLPAARQPDDAHGAGLPATGQAKADLQVQRILLVDDNRDAADSLAMLLEMCGHEVTIAYDGSEALHVAPRCRPHIALIDLAMPGMDGFEVVRAMRGVAGTESTRFVALTGFGQPADRQHTEAAGFDAHLVKPVELETLFGTIARLRQPD